MNRINNRTWITIAALVFLSACTAKSGDPAPPTAGKVAPPVTITVINACGRTDACRAAAAKLGVPAADFKPQVNAQGRIDFGHRETVITCDGAAESDACACRDKLGFGSVKVSPGASGINILVGWDAAPTKLSNAPNNGVLISKAEKAVFRYEAGELGDVWPCAIGKPESPTPAGSYEVTVTLKDPTWYWQGKAIPPGPENGLGKWFIGINKKGYGVHGTNEPASIGTAASHGCVRMYNEDVGELVKLVKAGTAIIITD